MTCLAPVSRGPIYVRMLRDDVPPLHRPRRNHSTRNSLFRNLHFCQICPPQLLHLTRQILKLQPKKVSGRLNSLPRPLPSPA